jgi:hypothetical protein
VALLNLPLMTYKIITKKILNSLTDKLNSIIFPTWESPHMQCKWKLHLICLWEVSPMCLSKIIARWLLSSYWKTYLVHNRFSYQVCLFVYLLENIVLFCFDYIISSKDGVSFSSRRPSVILTKKHIKSSPNFNLSYSLNSLYENLVRYKNLECFELFKSSFLIF